MDADEGNGATVSATTAAEASSMAHSFEGGSTTPPPGVVLGINLLAINPSSGPGSSPSPGAAGGGAGGGAASGTDSVMSGASRNRDESASEEGLCDERRRRRTGSSSAGSRRSRDRSNSDSSSGRSTRQRRAGGGRSSRRDRDRSRDDGRHHHSGGSSSSLSPRWDRGAGAGNGNGNGNGSGHGSPRRRGGGGGGGGAGDGSPREVLEPSKVLHVRNVGYPVAQADLVALLSCFGQVEKIKMFSGQALVQLPSVSVAKATMRHYEEDEEPKIGSKKVYLNYSRSRSIETRDGESLAVNVGNFNSNNSSSSNGGGGGNGNSNGGSNGLDLARAINAARGLDGNGSGNPLQETPSPYAHLIMEDHAKLLGLATCYLQNYGIPGGEGAILNINQREEMAERQRQAIAAAVALNGINGHGHHGGMGGWSGNAAAVATAAVAEASRHSRGMSGGGAGMFSGYGGARLRSGSRGGGGRGGPSQR